MIAAALADLLPPEVVLEAAGDAALWRELGAEPEAVVRPGSTEEVASTLAWASRSGVRVVPAGSAAGLPSGSVAAPFVVLSTTAIQGVETYEPADLTITAAAGTSMAALGAALAEHRQWLPFDPPRARTRSLGGLVACGASGPLRTGYGEFRNHVLGATVVTGDGRVLRLGGRVVKNVAGFDLLRAVVGSRGRLGVLTSVCVRVFPVPEADRLLWVTADSVADLIHAARAVATAPALPASTVLMSPAPPELGGGAALVVRLHGASAAVAADRHVLEQHMGRELQIVPDERHAAVLERVRDHAAEADIVLRISALPSRLAEVLAGVSALGDLALAADVHGGEVRVALSVEAAAAQGAGDLRRLREEVEALGGSLGLERWPHGLDAEGVRSTPTAAEAELIERVARVFDPAGTLAGIAAGGRP